MRSRSWIRWWQLWFLISRIIFVTLLCIFYIFSMSPLKCGQQNCTACSRCGQTGDLYNRVNISLLLHLKMQAINTSTLSAVLKLFWVCFLPVEVLGNDISSFINIVIHLPLVCPLNKNCIYLYRPGVPLCHSGFYSSLAKFGIIEKCRHFTNNIGIQIIYIYKILLQA